MSVGTTQTTAAVLQHVQTPLEVITAHATLAMLEMVLNVKVPLSESLFLFLSSFISIIIVLFLIIH
jgi:hypothetical protein